MHLPSWERPRNSDVFDYSPVKAPSIILDGPRESVLSIRDSRINGFRTEMSLACVPRNLWVRVKSKFRVRDAPDGFHERVVEARKVFNEARRWARVLGRSLDAVREGVGAGDFLMAAKYLAKAQAAHAELPALCDEIDAKALPVLLKYHESDWDKSRALGGEARTIRSLLVKSPAAVDLGVPDISVQEWRGCRERIDYETDLILGYMQGQNLATLAGFAVTTGISIGVSVASGGAMGVFGLAAVGAAGAEAATKMALRRKRTFAEIDILRDSSLGDEERAEAIEKMHGRYDNADRIAEPIFIFIAIGFGLVDLQSAAMGARALVSGIKSAARKACAKGGARCSVRATENCGNLVLEIQRDQAVVADVLESIRDFSSAVKAAVVIPAAGATGAGEAPI